MSFLPVSQTRNCQVFCLLALLTLTLGCGGGSGQSGVMTTDFTDEQKAAILAEQEAVFEQESGGVVNKKSRKKN